jgi:hypothetical protein
MVIELLRKGKGKKKKQYISNTHYFLFLRYNNSIIIILFFLFSRCFSISFFVFSFFQKEKKIELLNKYTPFFFFFKFLQTFCTFFNSLKISFLGINFQKQTNFKAEMKPALFTKKKKKILLSKCFSSLFFLL